MPSVRSWLLPYLLDRDEQVVTMHLPARSAVHTDFAQEHTNVKNVSFLHEPSTGAT